MARCEGLHGAGALGVALTARAAESRIQMGLAGCDGGGGSARTQPAGQPPAITSFAAEMTERAVEPFRLSPSIARPVLAEKYVPGAKSSCELRHSKRRGNRGPRIRWVRRVPNEARDDIAMAKSARGSVRAGGSHQRNSERGRARGCVPPRCSRPCRSGTSVRDFQSAPVISMPIGDNRGRVRSRSALARSIRAKGAQLTPYGRARLGGLRFAARK